MAKRNLKDWYKSKTIWVAILQGVAGLVVAFSTEYPEAGGLLLVKSLVDFGLRMFTNKAVK